MPDQDLYLTPEHPIRLYGREIMAQDLPEAEPYVTESPETVYTPCLERRDAVMIAGTPVMAWSRTDWEQTQQFCARK